MADVTVIGAGVSGLTTALALRGAGHRVRIVASARGSGTTSAVAGAVWYPYRVGPPDRANVWAAVTRDWLLELARTDPSAGVDVLTRYELADDDREPWWAASALDLTLLRSGFPGEGLARFCWSFTAPRCEPAVFMPWLERQLPPVEIRQVSALADEAGDLVVNCTGLGARALTGDAELVGIYGQVVMVEPGQMPLDNCVGDERDDVAIFYSIPRRGEIVLGGCAEPGPDNRPLVASEAMTRQILERTARLGLKPGAVRRAAAGLRPFRPSVRLERDQSHPRIIHNYGHGGAGYTLCWGCASDVAALAAAL